MHFTRVFRRLLIVFALAVCGVARGDDTPIRIGLIGLDTSHAVAFTDLFNAAEPAPEFQGLRVVAGFPDPSNDIASSRDRVQGYTDALRGKGVEIVDSIPALLARVDVVMLESVDGRKHLAQARPVFEAGKLVFIDKPLAASLADAVALAELAKQHDAKWFSASALRFTPAIASMPDDPKIGRVVGCNAWSPGHLDPTHPDLFWYGIHGVETLFTVMGPGCISVSRTHTPDTDLAVGVWSDGRVGTFRGIRNGKNDFGATAFGAAGVVSAVDAFQGYQPLVVEIAKFFRTGNPPIAPEQTIEIIAFMEAAEESKRQKGKPVTIESVMEKARAQAAQRASAVGTPGFQGIPKRP